MAAQLQATTRKINAPLFGKIDKDSVIALVTFKKCNYLLFMKMSTRRPRFSKRRSRRKTSFPLVAVIQKRSKRQYISNQPLSDVGKKLSLLSSNTAEKNSNQLSFSEQKDLSGPRGSEQAKQVKGNQDLGKQNVKPSNRLRESQNISERKRLNRYSNSNLVNSRPGRVGSQTTYRSKSSRSSLTPGGSRRSRATIDYKNVVLLRKLITTEGKILPRRINKLTAKQQRYTSKAIKSARVMGLLPFINKTRPIVR